MKTSAFATSRRLVCRRFFLEQTGSRDLNVSYAQFLNSRKLVVKSPLFNGRIACPFNKNYFKGHDRYSRFVGVFAEVFLDSVLPLAGLLW